jgi:hypothetical protein
MTAVRDAVRNSGAGKVLYLSTIGAQARQTTVLSQHTIGEFIFGQLEIPVTSSPRMVHRECGMGPCVRS